MTPDLPPSQLPVGACRWLVSRPGGEKKDIVNHITKVGNSTIGLNRPVSYWMFTQRVQVIPTEAEVHANFAADRMMYHLLAIWDFEWECGHVRTEKPRNARDVGGPYPVKKTATTNRKKAEHA